MLLSLQEACDYNAEHGKSKAALPFVPPVYLAASGLLRNPASPRGSDTHGVPQILQEGLPILAIPQGLGKFVLKYGSANKAETTLLNTLQHLNRSLSC